MARREFGKHRRLGRTTPISPGAVYRADTAPIGPGWAASRVGAPASPSVPALPCGGSEVRFSSALCRPHPPMQPLRQSVTGGDGGYVVCGYFVSKVVDEGDVYWPLGAAGFTHHSRTLGSWEVSIAPLLEGADEYV